MIKAFDSLERALVLGRILLERKAEEMVLLDVRELCSFTDFLLILSGRSTRQVQALAEHLLEKTKEQRLLPLAMEGETWGRWIVIDFDTVVVHIFVEELRTYYDLEGLWSEAGRYDWREDGPEPCFSKAKESK